jgi:uncharacterized MnhB-related membrane protein
MKQLSYAISLAVPVITALFLIVLAIIAGDLVVAFLQSGVTDLIITELQSQPSAGTWAISGAIVGSIVSIMLLATYEAGKHYYLITKTDKSVINSIIDELDVCQQYIKACSEHLELEIAAINKRPQATLVAPPPRIEIDIWELIKSHLPIAIAKDNNLLSGLRILNSYITSFNSQLDSREQYHIHCKINTNFYEQMEIFDNDLLSKLPQLQEFTEGVIKEVKKL